MLDEFDRKILRVLQSDPAVTMSGLAEAVGLSQTPCWRRVKQMEASGVIAGRAVLLDAGKLGYGVVLFASVRIGGHDEDTLNRFEEQVATHPEIVDCYSMSGDSDYLLRILVDSIQGYERFLKETLLHLPGVVSLNSNFALKRVKSTTCVPV